MQNYPVAYNKGFGPTTKAERWNGRHAMAGWIVLLATGTYVRTYVRTYYYYYYYYYYVLLLNN
jgi:hypothetical protein